MGLNRQQRRWLQRHPDKTKQAPTLLIQRPQAVAPPPPPPASCEQCGEAGRDCECDHSICSHCGDWYAIPEDESQLPDGDVCPKCDQVYGLTAPSGVRLYFHRDMREWEFTELAKGLACGDEITEGMLRRKSEVVS